MLSFFRKWKWPILVVAILSIGAGVYLFTRSSSTQTTQYSTIKVSKEKIVQSVTASGSISALQQKNYGFKTSGTLKELNVKLGDQVKPGQQLAKIDTTNLEIQLAGSQSALKIAQNNYNNRYKTATNQYDTANLQETVNSTQAKVNTDQAALDNTILKSPKDGKISVVSIHVGDNVSTSTSSFAITNADGNDAQNIFFAVSGKVVEINKNQGDTVSAGDILGKLDNTQAKNQLIQSQGSLNQAKNNLANRFKSSLNNLDTDNLQQNVKTAESKVLSDQTNLDAGTLRADIDGVVAAINSSPGDSISGSGTSSGTSSTTSSNTGNDSSTSAVVTVINQNTLVTSLNFPESDISKVKIGQEAQLTLDALDGKQFSGKVHSIDTVGSVSSNVVSYGVKVAFDNIAPEIKHDMTVTATIITDTKDNVFVIPNSTIKSSNSKRTVQILTSDPNNQNDPNNPPKVETREIKIGISNDTQTEVLEGLKEGDLLVTGTSTTGQQSSNGNSLINLGT